MHKQKSVSILHLLHRDSPDVIISFVAEKGQEDPRLQVKPLSGTSLMGTCFERI
jgi:hypothetical protein